MNNYTADELLTMLDEATETTEYLRKNIRFLQQLLNYWETRQKKLEETLPGLVQAEQVAGAVWYKLIQK